MTASFRQDVVSGRCGCRVRCRDRDASERRSPVTVRSAVRGRRKCGGACAPDAGARPGEVGHDVEQCDVARPNARWRSRIGWNGAGISASRRAGRRPAGRTQAARPNALRIRLRHPAQERRRHGAVPGAERDRFGVRRRRDVGVQARGVRSEESERQQQARKKTPQRHGCALWARETTELNERGSEAGRQGVGRVTRERLEPRRRRASALQCFMRRAQGARRMATGRSSRALPPRAPHP